jgi:predicted HicB family RNase H-like nuclease
MSHGKNFLQNISCHVSQRDPLWPPMKPMDSFVKVRLPSQLAKQLEKKAEADHVTVSHVVRAAIREFFAETVSQAGKGGAR